MFTCEVFKDNPADIDNPRDCAHLGLLVLWNFNGRFSEKEFETPIEAVEYFTKNNLVFFTLFVNEAGNNFSTKEITGYHQVGFVFADPEVLKDETYSEGDEDRIKTILIEEIDILNKYMIGEVYGFCIKDGDGEVVEQYHGFYDRELCADEAKKIADSMNIEYFGTRSHSRQAVWKFPLFPAGENVIQMPVGAEILCVKNRNETPCLYAICNVEGETESRRFSIYGTGNEHETIDGKYIDSIYLREGESVYHVFEII